MSGCKSSRSDCKSSITWCKSSKSECGWVQVIDNLVHVIHE
jgi:hypothetical protein